MARPDLETLLAEALRAEDPSLPPPSKIAVGGVDPLGLRQLNFDLMDKVLPGLNNVARHLRPFIVVAWACRRASEIAGDSGLTDARVDDILDFVDRIEVIYTWSQFLQSSSIALPGRDVLNPLIHGDRYVFGGAEWRKRRAARRDSTALTAALNYGPALKTLGWVQTHPKHRRLLLSASAADAALDSFQSLIEERLAHPAFSQFGEVEVTSKEVSSWASAWSNQTVTSAERETLAGMLFGPEAPPSRQAGGALMIAAAQHSLSMDPDRVRGAMAGTPSHFAPADSLIGASAAWRRMQIRQVFRLALESMLSWIIKVLDDGPSTTSALVAEFLAAVPDRPTTASTVDWLDRPSRETASPTGLMAQLQASLVVGFDADLPSSIADALAFCLSEPDAEEGSFERDDRLPLRRARTESDAWKSAPVRDFLAHVVDSWIIAQHVYWSVGRGLADARARGKTILRLRIVLEEGGWTLAPGARRTLPIPTPDRLQPALSLANECGLLDFSEASNGNPPTKLESPLPNLRP